MTNSTGAGIPLRPRPRTRTRGPHLEKFLLRECGVARCTIVQSAVMSTCRLSVCLSVGPSVTLVDHGHIGC